MERCPSIECRTCFLKKSAGGGLGLTAGDYNYMNKGGYVMQDRYTGDIGDFGKLGLLRRLQAAGLSVGVNWYRVPNETHNDDGKHIRYLEQGQYRECDEQLWYELRKIVVSGERTVYRLQNDSVLQAVFFSDLLDNREKRKQEREMIRQKWHEAALSKLKKSDIVFLDPDNGLIVPSAVNTGKANKYVMPEEIADYYGQGSSVIYYQHKARRQDSFYIKQQNDLLQMPGFDGASGLSLKFTTTSLRYYYIIMQPKHREVITTQIESMLSSAWGEHFCHI